MDNFNELIIELFLDRVPTCRKCDKMEWISIDNCPNCGTKYTTTRESRTREQQYLMLSLENMPNDEKYMLYLESQGYSKWEARKALTVRYNRRFDF